MQWGRCSEFVRRQIHDLSVAAYHEGGAKEAGAFHHPLLSQEDALVDAPLHFYHFAVTHGCRGC